MNGMSRRSMFHEVGFTPTDNMFHTKAFCWDCSQTVAAKGGTRRGPLKRFTCAACVQAKAAKKQQVPA